MWRTQASVCAVQGALSDSKWNAFRVFLASARSFDGFAWADVSAALRVRTLLGSPAEGEGDGWAVRVSAADAALFSASGAAAFAGMVLLPVTGCTRFLNAYDRREFMLEREGSRGVYFF